MPRMLAACVRLPRQWRSVSRIRSRSTSATVRPTRPRVTCSAAKAAFAAMSLPRPSPRRAPSGDRMPSMPISGPLESSTARCSVFSNSRTLPGQRCVLSARRASADSARTGMPFAAEYFLMKCCASSAMSAGRSRSAGIFRLTTLRRNSRSSRNVPARTASVRLRFEVAMMRMSTATGRLPPTRSMTRSWIARRSLACKRTSISEISSSSSVPPFASSNLPMRRATAPVNDPFSWPNNSDSSRFSGIAAQFTETNAFFARGLFLCT